jgi:sulfur-oxidizing protein SoxY
MNRWRRTILKLSGAALVLGNGLVKSAQAYAATWNKTGFESKVLTDSIKALGATGAAESKDIVITAPDIAENGAVVPIAVVSHIPNTRSISILAEKNPFPLAATFDISGTDAYVSTRVKMGQTANLRVIVQADGKFYTAAKEVKITIGGCG